MCACAEYAACWFAIEGLAPATSKPRLFFLFASCPMGVLQSQKPGSRAERLNDLQRTQQVARIPPTGGISSISLAWEDFCTIIKGSQLEVLGENSQVLQPTAGDQPQTQVNEGGKLLHCTPRTSNRARGGQLTLWSLLFWYVGEITSGRICWSSACQVGSVVQIMFCRICCSEHLLGQICWSDQYFRGRICWSDHVSDLPVRSGLSRICGSDHICRLCCSDHIRSDLLVRSACRIR